MKGIYAQVNVNLPDDGKIIEAGDLAELAYIRCILRGRQYLTDGQIDRKTIGRWLIGIRGRPQTHMERLVNVGLLIETESGWAFPQHIWEAWNPTKAQVDAKREAEASRKRAQRVRKSPSGTDAPGANLSQPCPRQSETESKTETESETTQSSQILKSGATDVADDDDPVSTIIDAIIAKRTVGRVADPVAHLRKCRANFAAQERLALDHILATRPHLLADPDAAAAFYLAKQGART